MNRRTTLFYSKKCKFCMKFLVQLKQNNLLNYFSVKFCVDGRLNQLPRYVTTVPTIVVNEFDEPLDSEGAFNWLRFMIERNAQETQKVQQKQNKQQHQQQDNGDNFYVVPQKGQKPDQINGPMLQDMGGLMGASDVGGLFSTSYGGLTDDKNLVKMGKGSDGSSCLDEIYKATSEGGISGKNGSNTGPKMTSRKDGGGKSSMEALMEKRMSDRDMYTKIKFGQRPMGV